MDHLVYGLYGLLMTAANLGSVIDPLMAEWIGKRKRPGAVVVVATREAEVFAKGYGLSDIAAKRPFTADLCAHYRRGQGWADLGRCALKVGCWLGGYSRSASGS